MVRGVIICRNGVKYDGQLRNDEPHGKGVKTFANGDVYKGDFVDG